MIVRIQAPEYTALVRKHWFWIFLILIASIGNSILLSEHEGWRLLFSFILWMEFWIIGLDNARQSGFRIGYERTSEVMSDAFVKAIRRLHNWTRTIEEWAEDMEPNIRKIFLGYARANNSLEKETPNMWTAIDQAFPWINTEQGITFWYEFAESYRLKEKEVEWACCAKPAAVSPIQKCRKHGEAFTQKRCPLCQKEYDARRKLKITTVGKKKK